MISKLSFIFRAPSVSQEKEFQRFQISEKRDWYLQTNPMVRLGSDFAYREKIALIKSLLHDVQGPILDLGGNVAGEAIVLKQLGRDLVVGDINEVALGISKERCEKFFLTQPPYLALDVHSLPIKENSFSCVTVIEALHHFYSYPRALSEIKRILRPGGKLISIEPNGLNPIRRLSEIRDRFRGSIEKSFFCRQLNNLCVQSGFSHVRIQSVPFGKSSLKLDELSPSRQKIAKIHGWLSQNYPAIFGNLVLEAYKPGK